MTRPATIYVIDKLLHLHKGVGYHYSLLSSYTAFDARAWLSDNITSKTVYVTIHQYLHFNW